MTYKLQVKMGDDWHDMTGGGGQRGYLSGYLQRHREQGGPRVAMRLMREGHAFGGGDLELVLISNVEAIDAVSLGQVAGFPTAEQYERAGTEALERAALIREREAERETRRGTP